MAPVVQSPDPASCCSCSVPCSACCWPWGGPCGGQGEVSASQPYNQIFTAPSRAPWGGWGPTETCPEGSFASGFPLKVQPYHGDAVEEAAEALGWIRLHCSDGPTIQSSVGGWGRWLGARYCLRGYVQAISLRVEPWQHTGDAAALTDVRFFCCPP